MGYHSSRRTRTEAERHLGPVEIAGIVVVVLAVAGLIIWMVTTAGGGVLMN